MGNNHQLSSVHLAPTADISVSEFYEVHGRSNSVFHLSLLIFFGLRQSAQANRDGSGERACSPPARYSRKPICGGRGAAGTQPQKIPLLDNLGEKVGLLQLKLLLERTGRETFSTSGSDHLSGDACSGRQERPDIASDRSCSTRTVKRSHHNGGGRRR